MSKIAQVTGSTCVIGNFTILCLLNRGAHSKLSTCDSYTSPQDLSHLATKLEGAEADLWGREAEEDRDIKMSNFGKVVCSYLRDRKVQTDIRQDDQETFTRTVQIWSLTMPYAPKTSKAVLDAGCAVGDLVYARLIRNTGLWPYVHLKDEIIGICLNGTELHSVDTIMLRVEGRRMTKILDGCFYVVPGDKLPWEAILGASTCAEHHLLKAGAFGSHAVLPKRTKGAIASLHHYNKTTTRANNSQTGTKPFPGPKLVRKFKAKFPKLADCRKYWDKLKAQIKGMPWKTIFWVVFCSGYFAGCVAGTALTLGLAAPIFTVFAAVLATAYGELKEH